MLTQDQILPFAKGPYTFEEPNELPLTYYLTKPDLPEQMYDVHLPYHLGMLQEESFFISEAIPEAYRPFMLRHEQDEYLHFSKAGAINSCLLASEKEYGSLPEDLRKEYVKFRAKQFADLRDSYGDLTGEFIDRIQASAHFWAQMQQLQTL